MGKRKPLCKNVNNPAIARLGKRISIKRIAKPAYDSVRQAMRRFLKEVLSNAIQYAEHRWRKSVTWDDVRDAVMYMAQWQT